jgi:hypothetical protein
MARVRYALALCGTLAVLAAGRAHAQSCHAPVPSTGAGGSLHLGVAVEAASYRNSRFEGDFQGLLLSADWESRWLRARAVMPGYRILRNGAESFGPGDLLTDAHLTVLRAAEEQLVGGLRLALTSPTGDSARGLGMGHFMVMPGLWMRWQPQAVFVQALVGYGGALAAGEGGHHHSGAASIVNPMNASEFDAALSGGYRLAEAFRLRAGLYGAMPFGVADGLARAAATLGVDMAFDWFELSLEGHLPLVGAPFAGKVVTLLGARL